MRSNGHAVSRRRPSITRRDPFWARWRTSGAVSRVVDHADPTRDVRRLLVAEVHPFDDGNGRLARAVMNADYVAGDEQRAVIPTISRIDYLRALRRLSRQDRPDLFVTVLDRVRRWTARMDWSTVTAACELLARTNAFVDANDAEDRGLHLLDPATDDRAIRTGGPA